MYFDIESMQVTDGDDNTTRQVPNLVVAGTDSGDLQHWYGPNCIRHFVAWLD